jgi:hypothetical protein
VKQNIAVRMAASLLLCLALSTSAFAFQGPQPFSADSTTTSTNGNLNMSGKIYVSMPSLRMDIDNASSGKSAMGGKMSMIVNTSNNTNYMLMHDQHMYMEFPANADGPGQRMPKFQDFMKGNDPCAGNPGATCKKAGTETVNGRSCDKWEMTDKSGKAETIWMDQKLHFPIKVINGNITTQHTNVKEGPQDASLFKVPAGYQKLDAGAMSGGRPH